MMYRAEPRLVDPSFNASASFRDQDRIAHLRLEKFQPVRGYGQGRFCIAAEIAFGRLPCCNDDAWSARRECGGRGFWQQSGYPMRRVGSSPSSPHLDGPNSVLLTVAETAVLLRTSRKAIYAMVERGKLPGVVRLGKRLLFRRQDLMSWLDQLTHDGFDSQPELGEINRRGRV